MNAAMLLTSLTSKLLAGRNVAHGSAEDGALLGGGQASGDFAALLAQQFEGVDVSSSAEAVGRGGQPETLGAEEGDAGGESNQPFDFSYLIPGQVEAAGTQPASSGEAQAQTASDLVLQAAQSAPLPAAMAAAAVIPQSIGNAAETSVMAGVEGGRPVAAVVSDAASAGRQSAEMASTQRQPVAVPPASFAVSELPDRFETQSAVSAAPQAGFDKVLSEVAAVSSAPVGQSVAMSAVSGLQVAAMPSSQPQSPSQAAAVLSPVVGQSAWGDALGDRMVWMVSQQHQGVELHLNPPALGPLEVRLSMSDGQATLSFSTQHLPVKEALESATPRLKEMLGESGINLAGVSVNVGSFSQPRGGFDQRESGSPASWSSVADAPDVAAQQAAAGGRVIVGRGMVDLFA